MSARVHDWTELSLTVHYILICTQLPKLFIIKQTDRQDLVVITDYIVWTHSSVERKPKYRSLYILRHKLYNHTNRTENTP